MAEPMFSRDTQNFVDLIHQSHLDNAQNLYTAKRIGRGPVSRSVSPLTNFVFEYFIFNSLYTVDWVSSVSSGALKELPRDGDFSETKQQRAFLNFCKEQLKCSGPEKAIEAFLPLFCLDDLMGSWTTVSADSRISAEDGQKFFGNIAELGELANRGELKPTKDHFKLINNCCYFVYLVRNNIFHGSKSIGEIYDPSQARRIGVYDMFVRCLNSLFFIVCGKKEHGAALTQLPILQSVGDAKINLTIQEVFELVIQSSLKSEDSFLHRKLLHDGLLSPTVAPSSPSALFYPSAGDDVLFPLIVGMPCCTDFFFFNESPIRLDRIKLGLRKLDIHLNSVATETDDSRCYSFSLGAIERRIWLMERDNLDFLYTAIPVSFYFHRGDSTGEGGSNQRWDSELLPSILERAPSDVGLRILTDGEPGGLDAGIKSQLEQVCPASSHRRRDYFYGVLHATR